MDLVACQRAKEVALMKELGLTEAQATPLPPGDEDGEDEDEEQREAEGLNRDP